MTRYRHNCQHRKHPKPRLFIAFNSCIILLLLIFLLLQGLVIPPLASVSFTNLILPDHTRHYVSSQTGINAYQIFTTFFATCYEPTASTSGPRGLNCLHHSFYFNWLRFLGTPDLLNDAKMGTSDEPTFYLGTTAVSFTNALALDKFISIASCVFLIIAISSRFVVMVACIICRVRHKSSKAVEDVEAQPLESRKRNMAKHGFLALCRVLFITAHSLAVPAGVVLAPVCLARSYFHIYNTYYGKSTHPAEELTFNTGLHALLWLVAFFSILDVRAARAYSFELTGKNNKEEAEENQEDGFSEFHYVSNLVLGNGPESGVYSIPLARVSTNSVIGGKTSECLCRDSLHSSIDLEGSILNNPLFEPLRSQFDLHAESSERKEEVRNEKYSNQDLFRPGSRDSEFSYEGVSSAGESSGEDDASLESLTVVSSNGMDDYRYQEDEEESLVGEMSRRGSLQSTVSLSSVSGSTCVGSVRSGFSETSSIISEVPSLISDTSSQNTNSSGVSFRFGNVDVEMGGIEYRYSGL